ncbi:MAG: DUF5719 family protein [Microbacteriaceae bacterium]|jgi:hypothetical protein|nr:DUF5719 family protein [Microbacteriaceae bacterium]MCI1206975.1 DUF5719 family protein [Microbacteriaceae bacterium]
MSQADSRRARRVAARSVVRIGTRVMSLLVCVALLLGAAFVLWRGWIPGIALTPSAQRVLPASTTQVQACAGPLRTGTSATTAGAGTAVGTSTVTAAGTELELGTLDGTVTEQPATLNGVQTVQSTGLTDPLAVRLSGARASDVTALQTASGGSLSGLSLSSCSTPSFDSWIQAGSTTTGRNTTLLLVNPSDLPAQAKLTLYTSSGVYTQQIAALRVPAHSIRAVPLAAYVPNLPALTVRVRSDRAPVASFVQSDITRVLQAGGSEITAAGAAPATEQVLTGVTIQNSATQNGLASDSSWSDALPVLRLLSPNGQTRARITIRGHGKTTTLTQQLLPGMTTDVPLTSLEDGDYRITVHASRRVVASARGVSGGQDSPEFSWLSSGTAFSGSLLLRVPEGVPDARLTLSAAGETRTWVRVTRVDADGSHTLEAGSGDPAEVTLPAGSVWKIRASGLVFASLTLSGDGQLAQTVISSESDRAAIRIREQ